MYGQLTHDKSARQLQSRVVLTYILFCVSTGFRRLGLLKGLAVLSGRSAYSTCITFSPVQARLCEKPMDTRFGCVFCSLLTYRHVPHLQ